MLLPSYPECRSRDAGEMEDLLRANAGGTHFDIGQHRTNFLFQVNMARLDDVTLLWSTCNQTNRIGYVPVSYLRHIFQIEKPIRLKIDGKPVRQGSPEHGYLVPSGRSWHLENEADFQNLSLRIESGALKRKLRALTGHDLAGDLEFQPSEHDRTPPLREAVFRFAHEIEAAGPHRSTTRMLEVAQALIVRYLFCSRHDQSHLLALQPLAASLAQTRRAQDFIAANWDKPLDIETLATVAGASARSLFRNFRRLLGSSPQAFIKQARLDQARTLLRQGDDSTSVMAIALRCGFHSLGHFARAYRDLFGELPSQTLSRNRSPRLEKL